MLVKIEKVPVLGNDARRMTYAFSTRESGYFIFAHRKRGTKSACHYHKGLMKSKAPEILYVVSGEITLTVRDIETNEEEIFKVKEGSLVEIPIKIYHEVEAETDAVMAEFVTTEDDFKNYKADSFKL